MRVKISKRYSFYSFLNLLQPNSCYRLLMVVPINVLVWNFEFVKRLITINDLIFTL